MSARRSRLGSQPLTTGRALVLGAVQGPAELLPVSSSAHITLLPWFAGWGWDRLDPAARKDFEVALHAGTLAALVVGQRRVIAREVERLDTRRAAAIVLAAAIPAVIGFVFERPIEERVGEPVSIAAGLVAGAAAMLLADRRPQDRDPDELGPWDGLALGAAQGAALYPGISRTGATVAAARWQRFSRGEANLLSRTVALPIVVGAVARRGSRVRHDPPSPAERRGMAVGALAAAASTLASRGLIAAHDRNGSVWPYALYRVAVAGAVLIKLRRGA